MVKNYIPRTSVNIVVAAVFRFPDKKLWSASVDSRTQKDSCI